MEKNVLDGLWEKLKGQSYLILRNYETMLNDICEGGDIDILCESKEEIVQLLDLKPTRDGINVYNYQLSIDTQKILVDIREVGDKYYDKNWEKNMLKNRIIHEDFFVLQEEDYIYSLLYHALIHKQYIADKYKKLFIEIFYTDSEIELLRILKRYMEKKNYKVVLPLDEWVNLNKKNLMLLTENEAKE